VTVVWYVKENLLRPILKYGSESWPILKETGNMLRIFERSILRMIYDPLNRNVIWKTRYEYSNELYTHYDEIDLVGVVKIERLRWLGHLFRMQELYPCRKITLLKNQKALDV
jgi:hypothetical protein